jgi:hypothetical protein
MAKPVTGIDGVMLQIAIGADHDERQGRVERVGACRVAGISTHGMTQQYGGRRTGTDFLEHVLLRKST